MTAQPAARVHNESVFWFGSLDCRRACDGADANREGDAWQVTRGPPDEHHGAYRGLKSSIVTAYKEVLPWAMHTNLFVS